MSFRAVLIAVAIALSSAVAAAPPPLAVDIKHRVGREPADFRTRVIVEKDPANRKVCLHADTDGFKDVRLSCWDADGTRSTWRWLKQLDTGKWDVYATVERNDGKTLTSAKVQLIVLGIGMEMMSNPFDDTFPTP